MKIEKKNILKAIGVAIMGYIMMAAMLYAFQRNLIYRYMEGTPIAPSWLSEKAIQTEDGLTLKAFWRAPQKDRPTILFLHGNAGHIGHRLFKVKPYAEKGFGIMMFSWRGYAGNPGSPTEEGLYADARAAAAFLKEKKIPNDEVFVYGESLGTAVAVKLAVEQKKPFLAVVLEAPFTSIPDLGKQIYPFMPIETLAMDQFRTIDMIDQLKAPLLVVVGLRDSLVPIDQPKALMAKAGSARKQGLVYPHLSHLELHEDSVFKDIIAFLGKVIKRENN